MSSSKTNTAASNRNGEPEPEALKQNAENDWKAEAVASLSGDTRARPWKKWVGDSVDTGFEDEAKEDIILVLNSGLQYNNLAA